MSMSAVRNSLYGASAGGVLAGIASMFVPTSAPFFLASAAAGGGLGFGATVFEDWSKFGQNSVSQVGTRISETIKTIETFGISIATAALCSYAGSLHFKFYQEYCFGSRDVTCLTQAFASCLITLSGCCFLIVSGAFATHRVFIHCALESNNTPQTNTNLQAQQNLIQTTQTAHPSLAAPENSASSANDGPVPAPAENNEQTTKEWKNFLFDIATVLGGSAASLYGGYRAYKFGLAIFAAPNPPVALLIALLP